MSNALTRWFVSDLTRPAAGSDPVAARIDWMRIVPFIGLHLACLGVLWTGVSAVALWVALVSYLIRMFAITGFFHRYFAHRSFRTGRAVQFLFAVLGTAATQRGPLWWAAHHRAHHRAPDTDADPHSSRRGLWWSHMGWFLCRSHFQFDPAAVRDWMRYPELVWLTRYDIAVPVAYAVGLFATGELLRPVFPDTSGWQMLVWGYFIATVVLIHATLCINSLAHRWGRRRFDTPDHSRNNWMLAIATLGEGWHNNHHRYAGSARQGFYWWEIDVAWYVLLAMRRVGWVRDLRNVPATVIDEGRP